MICPYEGNGDCGGWGHWYAYPNLDGSLSQRCHSSDTWTGCPVMGGSTWSSGIWGKTQRMRGLCEEYIAAANGSSLDWCSLN